MKKNVLVEIVERSETCERIIPAVYDENGEIVTEETVEHYTVNVPVMEARNVEMTAEEIAEMELFQPSVDEQIQIIKTELATYDYIGVKIAMGVATKEEYAKEIAYTELLRQKIRELTD